MLHNGGIDQEIKDLLASTGLPLLLLVNANTNAKIRRPLATKIMKPMTR